MATKNALWVYKSIERHGCYKLLLVPEDDAGKVRAQKQRFNADGTSVPFSPGDLFCGDSVKDAIEWLNQHHLQLTLRGWAPVMAVGAAAAIKLCSVKATKQAKARLQQLRKDRARQSGAMMKHAVATA